MADISEALGREWELALIYIAQKVSEAEAVQGLLEQEGIEYFTCLEEYNFWGALSAVFQSANYCGIGFYVLSGQAEWSRRLLRDHAFVRGLVG